MWCTRGMRVTKSRRSAGKNAKSRATTVRASISFPSDVYRALEALAKQNKVSLAWIVREAAEKYVAVKAVAPASGEGR